MKIRQFVISALCVLAAMGAHAVRADQVLYDASGFLSGQQSFVQALNITTPGTLTITLTNVAWPQELASLNLVIGNAKGLLGAEMGAGTETFSVTSGTLFAQWFGTAQGPLDLGVYSLNISFQPLAAPVPLPTSLLLLASGLLLWLAFQRRVVPYRGLRAM